MDDVTKPPIIFNKKNENVKKIYPEKSYHLSDNTDLNEMCDDSEETLIEKILIKSKSAAFKYPQWKKYVLRVNSSLILLRHNSKPDFKIFSPLLLCSIKDVPDKNYFLLISPTKQLVVRARNNQERLMAAITEKINLVHQKHRYDKQNACLDSTNKIPNPVMSKKDLATIKNVPGNEVCADCGDLDPLWASVSFFVTLCIKCSGAHRGLGVNVSRVRSLEMDEWPTNITVLFLSLGNNIVNSIFSYGVTTNMIKKIRDGTIEREVFVRQKYVERKYLYPLEKVRQNAEIFENYSSKIINKSPRNDIIMQNTITESNMDEFLIYYSKYGSMFYCMLLIAHGANINIRDEHGNTPLMIAIKKNWQNIVYYLLLNGADPNIADHDGNTALHLAASNTNSFISCILLEFHADFNIRNLKNQTPLMIAEECVNVDVVVVLKLATLTSDNNDDTLAIDNSLKWAIHDIAKVKFDGITHHSKTIDPTAMGDENSKNIDIINRCRKSV